MINPLLVNFRSNKVE